MCSHQRITNEELYEFAYNIIQLLSEPQESINYHGVNAKRPKTNKPLCEPMSEIVLDTIIIVNSKQERRELMNKIRVNCGMQPIDWRGRDKWNS